MSSILSFHPMSVCFFFNGPTTIGIYPLSLHDALPIYQTCAFGYGDNQLKPFWFENHTFEKASERSGVCGRGIPEICFEDRKSTRLNSSHVEISYAVFCLKKKTTHRSRLPALTHSWTAS